MAATKEIIKTVPDAKKEAPVEKKVVKKYEASDLIPVRSVTQGELLLPGKKTHILYRWAAYGDITEVEYQDLYSLKSSRSQYLYNPLFIVEDEGLLADPKWQDINKLYKKMYDSEDMEKVLRLPVQQFIKVLNNVPAGYLNAIKIEVATRIENGTFDSIKKIKAVDEICHTDFMSMIN